jgi:uncharacterized membrane protein YgcG
MRSLGWATSGLAVLLAAAPAAAQPKSLHWRELHVAADLDADGRLHVRERHSMVFTGAWNGGERRFDVRKGQSLQVRRISRVDPATGARELRQRKPPGVDEYAWADSTILRWRSRAPSDPPFHSTEIVYAIEYTLSGILSHRDGVYVLDHDFAFADRPGPITRFVLELRLDRVWHPAASVPPRVTVGPLLPGVGYRSRIELAHLGAAAPRAVDHGSPGRRLLLLALFASAVLLRLTLFWRGEKAAGRLERLMPVDRIDTSWLQENVFHLPAEVVGATWDRSVGAAEVAAALARLEGEGRIQTWTDATSPSVRHLRLLAPRASLLDHERVLVDALLVKGGDATDTRAVQRHYKSTGFDPAGVIRDGLEIRVREVLGRERGGRIAQGVPTVLLLVGGVAALSWALVREEDVLPFLVAAASLAVYLVAVRLAQRWRRRVDGGALAAAGVLVPIALLLGGVLFVHRSEPRVSLVALGGSVALALAFINSLLNQARATESPAALRLRKRLTSARRFLHRELRRGSPDVQVSWFPHLLALGLAEDADRWSAERPSAAEGPTSWSGAASGSSGGGSRSEPFSGGGGRFGGAGATGGWAATAQAFSMSVAAPSSSDGSGGGGSSSGGSSGGGGGGGW